MLVSLSIRDIVLIDHLNLSCKQGLSVLTGETGAGKSILLDALALAIGARGDANLVRKNAVQGSVIAVFEIPDDHKVLSVLLEHGIALPSQPSKFSELILRRLQMKDGKSRAFINDDPVSIKFLKQVGSYLIELHGQNESQSLTDHIVQLSLLDRYATHELLLKELAAFEFIM